jgi:ribosomal protein L16 Arg81 hydroxylase
MRSVDAIDLEALTAQGFRRRYVETRTPVVLRNFLRSWPACGAWTPASLAERFGAEPVEVMCSSSVVQPGESAPYRGTRKLTMQEFATLVSSSRCSDLYLVAQSQLLRQPAFASLWNDMLFDEQWFDPSRKETHVSLWMGPEGAATALHFDRQDALLAQAYGSKRVLLAAPSESPCLYRGASGYSPVDPEQPDLARYPRFRDVELVVATLEHGDALFLPDGWWHHVRALTASISLSMSNFSWNSH